MLWVLEAWRGVASAMVLWSHWASPLGLPMGLTAFAFTGVDLFFVLSGFVFAPVLLQRRVPSLRAYGLRRVLRIYPAYLVALGLYVALAWMAGRPLAHLPEHVLMAHLQSREMAFYYNPAFWSLPVEVEFYLLLPVLGIWLARGREPTCATVANQDVGTRAQRLHWRWALVLTMALTLRLGLAIWADTASQNLAYVFLNHVPGLLLEFLLGAWVWQRCQQPAPRMSVWIWAVAGLVGWCALAALFVQRPTGTWHGSLLGLGAAACFAAMLGASCYLPAPGERLAAVAQWGGRLSYSVYLLHIAWLAPALAWSARWGAGVGALLALAGLLASCLALHWLVEEPARRWGRRMARRWEQAGRPVPASGGEAGAVDQARFIAETESRSP